ncbi:hypothetical protein TCCBUS3UF1_7760 [Thermus sp. CCB_US3_UF1]|nr:hypothetical protein TCCBUS3UF1_7760 [Thermus sp. CCB_US3_UF1]
MGSSPKPVPRQDGHEAPGDRRAQGVLGKTTARSGGLFFWR